METFEPRLILCATDFSELAGHAMRHAAVLAERFDARLLALYADRFLPPTEFTTRQEADLEESLARSRRAAKAALEAQLRENAPGVAAAEALVVEDLPVTAILRTAEDRNADLIVLGTSGRDGVSHVLMGSVAERVLHEALRPVLTVRPRPGERESMEIRRVLCPVNYTELARRALGIAARVAERFGAELLVVHVAASGTDTPEPREMEQLCAWVPGGFRNACSVQELVRRGDAAEEIVRTCIDTGCDLIVLGAEHRLFFDSTVLGTTTTRVTRHAPCPVLTVPSGD